MIELLSESPVVRFDRYCLSDLSLRDECKAVEWVDAISRRTGTYPFWNRKMGKVFFCMEDRPSGAVWMQSLRNSSDIAVLDDPDSVCTAIYKQRMPMERKERIAEQQDRDAKDKARADLEREREHDRPELLKQARWFRNQVESKGLSRPSVTVP